MHARHHQFHLGRTSWALNWVDAKQLNQTEYLEGEVDMIARNLMVQLYLQISTMMQKYSMHQEFSV